MINTIEDQNWRIKFGTLVITDILLCLKGHTNKLKLVEPVKRVIRKEENLRNTSRKHEAGFVQFILKLKNPKNKNSFIDVLQRLKPDH